MKNIIKAALRMCAGMPKHQTKNGETNFDDWFCSSIRNAPVSPKLPLASSWDWNSKYGLPIKAAMDAVETV
jgi:hypothetical protein